MRFAGTRIEGFMDKERPDFGKMVQNADTISTKENNAYNDFQAKVGVAGINANAETEAAKLQMEGAKAEAAAAGNAAMMEGIGQIGSGLIGSFGSMGGGGGGFGGYSSGGVNTSNMTGFFNPNLF